MSQNLRYNGRICVSTLAEGTVRGLQTFPPALAGTFDYSDCSSFLTSFIFLFKDGFFYDHSHILVRTYP